MDRLDHMPEITDNVLGGLKADDSLKRKILLSAAESHTGNRVRRGTVFALCGLSLALILLCLFASGLTSPKTDPADPHVIPAGSRRIVSPVNLQNVIDQIKEVQVSGTD